MVFNKKLTLEGLQYYHTKIKSLFSNVNKSISDEVTRAKNAENTLSTNKLDKNQGTNNSGKIAGINNNGDIVPMIPQGITYNDETQCLEYGTDQRMNLNAGIPLDDTLSKSGYAADAAKVGELKGDLSNHQKRGIFDDTATLKDTSNNDISGFLCNVIKDIYIDGADENEIYAVGQINRTSNEVVQINIWNSVYTVVLAIYIADATGYTGVKTLNLSELNSSGMSGKITVDFDLLKTGVDYRGLALKSTKISKKYIFGSLREGIFLKKNDYEPYTRRWEGKKWYAIGDSFTEQNIYPYYLNQYCKFAEYHNAGWSGHCMKDMVTKITETGTSGYDVITVLCGTNDYGGGTVLGTISDSKDVDTFYGHTKLLIETIISQNPTARLCFFTPTIRGAFESQPVYPAKNSVNVGLDEYVDAIINVCEMYAIPCCDTFRTSQFNELTLSSLTQDNLHPNYDGGKLLARQMQGFIEAL